MFITGMFIYICTDFWSEKLIENKLNMSHCSECCVWEFASV